MSKAEADPWELVSLHSVIVYIYCLGQPTFSLRARKEEGEEEDNILHF